MFASIRFGHFASSECFYTVIQIERTQSPVSSKRDVFPGEGFRVSVAVCCHHHPIVSRCYSVQSRFPLVAPLCVFLTLGRSTLCEKIHTKCSEAHELVKTLRKKTLEVDSLVETKP